MKKAPRIGSLIGLLIAFSLCGCAVSYVDDEGNQHVIGLVNMSLIGVDGNTKKAGDKVEVENIGVMFLHGPLHTGVSVGYTHESTLQLKNDSLYLPDRKLDTDLSEKEIKKEVVKIELE